MTHEQSVSLDIQTASLAYAQLRFRTGSMTRQQLDEETRKLENLRASIQEQSQ